MLCCSSLLIKIGTFLGESYLNQKMYLQFCLTLILLGITLVLSFLVNFGFFELNFFVGSLRFTHWLGIVGSLFVFLFTPVFYVLKRKPTRAYSLLLKIHIFGNLFSFLLISIHFAQQVSRPIRFFPDLGTGVILFIIMPLIIITGVIHRFGIMRRTKPSLNRYAKPHLNRYVHTSFSISLYLLIIIHSAHGFNLI